MRPAQPLYFYPPQQPQQQQQQQPQVALHLNPGFAPIPVQQIATSAPFHPSYYAQSAPNGLQQYVGLPTGTGGALSGAHQRGVLPQDALLHQPWNHLPRESQVWGSNGSPLSPQGLMQPALLQHHPQQQQQQQPTYLQDIRPASVGGTGGILPQFQGADRVSALGRQAFVQSHETTGRFGVAAMGQGSRIQPDGMLGKEPFRGNVYGSGQPISAGKSHIMPHGNDNMPAGRWSRGGANYGANNPHSRGGKAEKDRSGDAIRSKAVVLRCDPCARNFTSAQQSNAHFSTHARCDVGGCSFEASGRVLKEHRQTSHGISSEMPMRSKSSRSAESEEELIKWREERKVNYPTTANIKRKAEEARAKKLRGELVDEDARKRRERLKEILARQAELGVPVAEVPSYYMSDHNVHRKMKGGRPEHPVSAQSDSYRNGKRPKGEKNSSAGMTEVIATAESSCSATPNSRKSARRSDVGEHPSDDVTKLDVKEPELKVARTVDISNDSREAQSVVEMEVDTEKDIHTTNEVKEHGEAKLLESEMRTEQGEDKLPKSTEKEKLCIYYMRGRCKKGNRCEFLHERRPKKKKEVRQQLVPKRTPTLLAKLLESDIRREKSHLLQAFRFFVNNMFLLEFPEKPLKFFDWQEDTSVGAEQQGAEASGSDEEIRTVPDLDLQTDGRRETTVLDHGSPMEGHGIEDDLFAADFEMHDEENGYDMRGSVDED